MRLMLTPNPKFRPSIFEMDEIFQNYFNIDNIKLNEDALRLKHEQEKRQNQMHKAAKNQKKLPKF